MDVTYNIDEIKANLGNADPEEYIEMVSRFKDVSEDRITVTYDGDYFIDGIIASDDDLIALYLWYIVF